MLFCSGCGGFVGFVFAMWVFLGSACVFLVAVCLVYTSYPQALAYYIYVLCFIMQSYFVRGVFTHLVSFAASLPLGYPQGLHFRLCRPRTLL